MPSNIYITAVGLISSLGYGFQVACAAARAGISRPTELDYYTVWSPTDGEVTPVTAHQIPDLTSGFEDDARRLRIMQAALADLRRSMATHRDPADEASWYLALPNPFREQSGAERVADEQIQREMQVANGQNGPHSDDDLAKDLVRRAARLAGFPGEPPVRFISRQGHAATAQCVMQACEDLETGTASQAIILACDSLLGESTLEWLENTGRLKSPANAVGLAPSESGVALLLEKPADTGRRMARIGHVRVTREDNTLLSGEPISGEGLAALLRSVAWSDQRPWIITDQNGEEYRAMEWGQALVRVIRQVPQLEDAVLNYPAIAFGDTGAASGGIGLATALHAFSRGCAPNPQAVILSASDHDARMAVELHNI